MLVLEVTNGPQRRQALNVTPGIRWAIGTSATCNLVLVDDEVASVHAEVSWGDQGVVVQDYDTNNGCLVNGEPISGVTPLRIGDHLQLGNTVLKLHEVEVEVAREMTMVGEIGEEPTDSEQGGLLALESAATLVQAPIFKISAQKTMMQPQIAAARVDAALIKSAANLAERVRGGGGGAKFLVQREGRVDPFWSAPVSIGRERSSGIVLDDEAASLQHAEIGFNGGEFVLRDLGSSNGSYVNGDRVVEAKLSGGDHIAIGRHVLVVVAGKDCLGLHVGVGGAEEAPSQSAGLGRVAAPRDGAKTVRKKKKASDLVWYGTSDLDRGSFRARSGLVALVLAVLVSVWMLASGDSKTLTGKRLSRTHESPAFVTQAKTFGRDRCTACHIGAGRPSSLKCVSCHPYSRPNAGHVTVDLSCEACHGEHRGEDYSSAAAAALSCGSCHDSPHDLLVRQSPKLVENFSIDAPADLQFHLIHQKKKVRCLNCHATEVASQRRGIRGACGQCHAPDHPRPSDCQQCHDVHPDREAERYYSELIPPQEPPRFAGLAIAWTLGLILLSFLIAGLLPSRSKMQAGPPS